MGIYRLLDVEDTRKKVLYIRELLKVYLFFSFPFLRL